MTSNTELARKFEDLEKKYDYQFKVVFEAIRQLMTHNKRDEREALESLPGPSSVGSPRWFSIIEWLTDKPIPYATGRRVRSLPISLEDLLLNHDDE